MDIKFTSSQTQKVETFRYTVDLLVTGTENIDSYDVYIDGNYLGSDLSTIQITDGDLVTIDITKITDGQESVLQTTAYLK